MEKITIGLQHSVDQASITRIRNLIRDLRPGDEVSITLEAADADQADPIFRLLEGSGFDYQSKGSHDGKTYYIEAQRKLH